MIKQIKEDLVKAIKEKNEFKKSVLRRLLAELENEKVKFKLVTVEKLKEEQVIDVVGRVVKALDKEMEEYLKVGKSVEKQEVEKEMLSKYLPRQLRVDEIKAEVVNALDLVDKGELTINTAKGYLAKKLKGKADMQQVIAMLMQKANK